MLRKTWAREEDGDKKVKRVFVIGQVEDEVLANSLVEESDRFGDLLQVDDCDDYNAIQCLCLGWLCRQLQKPDIQTPAVVQVGGGGMPAC